MGSRHQDRIADWLSVVITSTSWDSSEEKSRRLECDDRQPESEFSGVFEAAVRRIGRDSRQRVSAREPKQMIRQRIRHQATIVQDIADWEDML